MRGKSKQSDTSIVVMKRANKEGELSAESVERRGGTKGNSAHQSTDRTQSRATVTQAGVGYGGRRDLPSLPEVGAVCLNGHARICAGGAGQPVSLPRLQSPIPPCSTGVRRLETGAPTLFLPGVRRTGPVGELFSFPLRPYQWTRNLRIWCPAWMKTSPSSVRLTATAWCRPPAWSNNPSASSDVIVTRRSPSLLRIHKNRC